MAQPEANSVHWQHVALEVERARARQSALLANVDDSLIDAVSLSSCDSLHDVVDADADAERNALSEAEADYLAAIDALDRTGQPELAGRTLGNLGLLRWWQGRNDDARRCYDDALQRLRAHGSMAFEAVVLGNRTILEVEAQRLPEAAAGYEQVLALHKAMGNVMFEGVVSGNLAEVWEQLGQHERAHQAYERSLHLHRLCGDTMSEGLVLGNLGQLLLEEGDVAASRDVLEHSAALLVDAPPLYAALASGVASLAAQADGDLAAARDHLLHAQPSLAQVGAAVVQRFVWARSACVWADLGQVAEAEAFLEQAEAADTSEPPGALEAARAHLARARGDDPRTHLDALRALAEGSAAGRDPRIAWRILSESQPVSAPRSSRAPEG